MSKLTQERLKELLIYDALLGVFTWRVRRGGTTRIGSTAGCLHHSGYRYVRIDCARHFEHRLVWLYVHGYMPENVIHHVNHVRNDNRICNLEHRSKHCNGQSLCTNTSGVVGVYWYKRTGKWKAQIMIKGKNKYLGCFDTLNEAAEARRVAYEEAYPSQPCDI